MDPLSGLLSFIPGANFLGPLASGLGGLFGGAQGLKDLKQGTKDIKGLPGMQQQGIGGNFGQVGGNGQFLASQGIQNQQSALQGLSPALLSGGLFNDQNFQNAFQNNDIAGALGQANQGFSQQSGNTAFGGMGGLMGQLQGSLGQDFSGGLQNQLFGQGMQNQMAAGDQSALFNQSLATQRAAAQPQMDRQTNRLQDQLFAKGLLGQNSTATGEAFRGLGEAHAQADLGFQNNAFGQSQQMAQFLGQLGGQQMGQGQQFLGQNMNQFNQNIGQQMGLEGQGFNQNLQGMNFNASQGQNRLAAAQGLFGLGNDVMGQNVGLGLGASDSLLAMNQFGLDAARSPAELQAALLQGSGQHSGAIANLAQAQADASGGLFGGIGKGIGKLFSDSRLKKNIKRIGKLGDLGWYQWDWNDKARELMVTEPSYGVIAQEVARTHPEAVSEDKSGYLQVDYSKLVGV